MRAFLKSKVDNTIYFEPHLTDIPSKTLIKPLPLKIGEPRQYIKFILVYYSPKRNLAYYRELGRYLTVDAAFYD